MVDPKVTARVSRLVEPLLAARGLELADLEHKPGFLRVTVDRPGGVDLDTIAEVTRSLSTALDRDDPFPGKYLLEVTSPGVERPLRTPEQFRRAVGQEVAVRTHPGVEGERRVQGVLEAADDEGIVVAGRRLAHDEVERARTVFTWGPSPKPGKGRKPGSRSRADAGSRAP